MILIQSKTHKGCSCPTKCGPTLLQIDSDGATCGNRPSKQQTKAQQQKEDKTGEKNHASKFKWLPPATVLPEVWHKQEQQRQSLVKKKRQKVKAQKNKKQNQTPVYMKVFDNNTKTRCKDDNLTQKTR